MLACLLGRTLLMSSERFKEVTGPNCRGVSTVKWGHFDGKGLELENMNGF